MLKCGEGGGGGRERSKTIEAFFLFLFFVFVSNADISGCLARWANTCVLNLHQVSLDSVLPLFFLQCLVDNFHPLCAVVANFSRKKHATGLLLWSLFTPGRASGGLCSKSSGRAHSVGF